MSMLIRIIEYVSDNLQLRIMNKGEDEISYATNKKHTIKFKIVFIGDQAVGKSSIINRFIKNQFDPTHNPTVGIDFLSKNVVIADRSIRLQLWDTAGQERFRSLIPGYLRDSHAIFLVYDVTNLDSFHNVDMWLDYIKENRGEDVCIRIIANKIDCEQQRTVSFEQAREKFAQHGSAFIEVSAKTGENLEKLFTDTCDELFKGNEFETTVTHVQLPKKVERVTGEKERPITKAGSNKAASKPEGSEGAEMRGSKLQKKETKTGKYVKQKNCC